jgi:hypothetical protein
MKAFLKFLSYLVLGCVLVGVSGGGVIVAAKRHHNIKDTQACTLVFVQGDDYWFTRPNGEVFVMMFDEPRPVWAPEPQRVKNPQIQHLWYEDTKTGVHLVKVKFY